MSGRRKRGKKEEHNEAGKFSEVCAGKTLQVILGSFCWALS
jgi:hypothetical protein